MYRIKAPKQDNQSVPILANPEIVFAYSTNVVDTLHKKNLLLLGEDRYLTTLMLRTFPKRKLIFVSKAVCKTAVPEDFKVLLSQRRRWINSTVHNLLELMLVSELCGIFCCSMQFFVTMELIQTITMPSSCILLMYLIVKVASGADVLLPLIFLGSIFLLQSVVILLTTRKFIYLLWMIVFILATPVWNLILPIYAFWHFDDFSWGATRKLSSNVKGESQTEEEDIEHLDNEILEKYWTEWKDEMGTSAQPHKAIQNCDPLSNQVMLTHAPQPRISPVYNASEASPQSPIRFDVPFLHNHSTNETQHAEYLHKSSHRASAFHRLSQPISTYMPGFTSNHYPQFSDPSSSTNNSVTLPTRALNRRSRLIGPRAMSTPSSPRHYDYLSWNPS
ncbi:ATP-dependent RNA helicase [Basidiobolus ranarum]|uniref:chitin synthase n=1 Tax=Basidiobolus ranarum TaxID=34480 RepID=A0ABR2WWH3_9FUNG